MESRDLKQFINSVVDETEKQSKTMSKAEEETLEKIKYVLSCGNESQAIRILEQYGVYKQEAYHQSRVNAVSDEKLAEYFHNNYEEIALNNGWKTQDDCQVPFMDLPKENKETMLEVCKRVKQLLNK